MVVKTSSELAELVKDAVEKSGYKKTYIADQLGISRQAFAHIFDKKNFSVNDAERILCVIGCQIEINISKKVD